MLLVFFARVSVLLKLWFRRISSALLCIAKAALGGKLYSYGYAKTSRMFLGCFIRVDVDRFPCGLLVYLMTRLCWLSHASELSAHDSVTSSGWARQTLQLLFHQGVMKSFLTGVSLGWLLEELMVHYTSWA